MKSIATILFSVFCLHCSFAQNQTNIWYFGLFAGLDFNSGTPVPLTNGNTDTNEGTASICDNLGNLLFYTEGVQAWNRNNALMPNGFGLLGDVSTTQTLIVPHPGDSTLYYIFTLDDEKGPDGFNYSIVDMTLDGGNGDVTLKNSFLRASMSEKVAGVYHCNNHDIWVIAHEADNNTFTAYLATDNGISSPVVSNTGIAHTDIHGQMKFTSDGHRLACAVGYTDTVQVFDFDNKTGIVSNPLSLALGHHVYGIEFSPDNSKLYVTYYDLGGPSELVQFDLNAADVQASMVLLSTEFDPTLYGLQLASDGKVYVTKHVTPFVSVINSPNTAGIACDYANNVINIDPLGFGNTSKLGLPGFIQSYFHPDFPFEECNDIAVDFTSSDTILCVGDCISFAEVSACTTSTWQWTFAGASPDSSAVRNPVNICYAAPGDFEAKLIVSNGCLEDTVVKIITVIPAPALDAGENVTIATGASTPLAATGNVVTYQWTPAESLSATNIANPVAAPLTTTTYYVAGTDDNGCEAFDSVTVFVESLCGDIAIPSAFTPNDDAVNNRAVVLGACISTMHFAIYNRWGEKVFETTSQTEGWDGTYKGEPQPVSTFAYYLEATLETGEKILKKGSISLLR